MICGDSFGSEKWGVNPFYVVDSLLYMWLATGEYNFRYIWNNAPPKQGNFWRFLWRQHVVNHAVNTMKCMHINFYPAYIKDLITLLKTVFSLRGTDILSLCRPASASYGLPSLSHPSHRTEYNAYCLGTFTSSSTKFVDLSITRTQALPLWNMMKVAN